jgi:hypothetical protein
MMMTEDDILAAADSIRARRLNEKRLQSFVERETVMIRWDVPGAKFGESYVSVLVPRKAVDAVVRKHYAPLVAK